MMYDQLDINEFLFDITQVGNWEGEEELASDNINRVYHRLFETASDDTEITLFREMLDAIWPYWQHQPGLVELDDELIDHFIAFLIEEFSNDSEE
ncbi:MAG: hypothetical protein HRU22_08650 [Gammaproteobacteria bacterium]|nr:hypothetical protein [Gammaproteobacteria bacterium]